MREGSVVAPSACRQRTFSSCRSVSDWRCSSCSYASCPPCSTAQAYVDPRRSAGSTCLPFSASFACSAWK